MVFSSVLVRYPSLREGPLSMQFPRQHTVFITLLKLRRSSLCLLCGSGWIVGSGGRCTANACWQYISRNWKVSLRAKSHSQQQAERQAADEPNFASRDDADVPNAPSRDDADVPNVSSRDDADVPNESNRDDADVRKSRKAGSQS